MGRRPAGGTERVPCDPHSHLFPQGVESGLSENQLRFCSTAPGRQLSEAGNQFFQCRRLLAIRFRRWIQRSQSENDGCRLPGFLGGGLRVCPSSVGAAYVIPRGRQLQRFDREGASLPGISFLFVCVIRVIAWASGPVSAQRGGMASGWAARTRAACCSRSVRARSKRLSNCFRKPIARTDSVNRP